VRNGNNFSFINLPFGEYILAGDKPGIQPFYSGMIELSPSQPKAENIKLICSPSGFKFSLPDYLYPDTKPGNIKLFPNPVYDRLYISGLTEQGDYTIRIINSQGHVNNYYPESDGFEFNTLFLNMLPSGFYIIEIYNNRECLLRQKLIKY
jgi:hypothetical protein